MPEDSKALRYCRSGTSRPPQERAQIFAKRLRKWFDCVGATSSYFTLGKRWENGYSESCIDKLRFEMVHREIVYTLGETRMLIENRR